MTYIDPHGKAVSREALSRVWQWQDGSPAAPMTIEVDLSSRCDLGCLGCHFAYTHTRGPWASTKGRALPMAHDPGGDMADPAIVRRLLTDAALLGVKGIVWSGGGEPTLHPNWTEMVRHAFDAGLEQGLYTHGGRLTAETAAVAKRLLAWVVVSLDAADEHTYAAYKRVSAARFHAACDGIRMLTGGSAVVGVSFLLSESNWVQAAKMLTLARTLGATYATFRPLIETSPTEPGHITADRTWVSVCEPLLGALAKERDVELDVSRFLAYRDWQSHGYASCLGPTLTTTVTPDGRVWICPNRREYAGSCLGDLRTESLAAIWARHPRAWSVDRECRVMCRLHGVNTALDAATRPRPHGAFI